MLMNSMPIWISESRSSKEDATEGEYDDDEEEDEEEPIEYVRYPTKKLYNQTPLSLHR